MSESSSSKDGVDNPARRPISYNSGEEMMHYGTKALHQDVADKVEKAMGAPFPRMEVRFQNVSMSASVKLAHDPAKATSGQYELPTLSNHAVKMFSGLFGRKYSAKKTILNNVSGVFKPGTVTLILGQSESGKSALMKLLAGQFPMDSTISLSGDVSYNGRSREQLLSRLPRFASYVNQTDVHFPTLTVAETMAFAHECCVGDHLTPYAKQYLQNGTTEENAAALEACEGVTKHAPEVVAHEFGLQNCYNTIVGDAQMRGVSGGERKRVTSAEMELGLRYACFLDEISTGLDSAATYDVINTHRSMAQRFNKMVVISLLQPPPEVFELFDNVLLLNDGEMLYHGPCDQVLNYFERVGLRCPPNRDTADFLCDLATEKQEAYEITPLSPEVSTPPKDASVYAEYFRGSPIYKSMMSELQGPVDDDLLRIGEEQMDPTPEFLQGFFPGTWTVMKRQMLVLMRNKPFIRSRSIFVIVMALIYGSVFYNVNMEDTQVVLGVVFAMAMFLGIGQASMTPVLYTSRNVFYKHRAANFYRTSSYVISTSLSVIPLAFAESIIFVVIVYWMVGLIPTAAQFFVFEVFLMLGMLIFLSFFLLLSSAVRTLHEAKPFSMFTVELFVLFSGFIVPRSQLADWLVWIYWIDPISWTLRSIMVSQYRSDEYDVCEVGNVNYCDEHDGMTMGEYSLSLYSIPSNKNWVWLGVIYMAACYVFFSFLAYLVLENYRHQKPLNISVGPPKKTASGADSDTSSDGQEHDGYALVQTPRDHDQIRSGTDEHAIRVDTNREKMYTPVTVAFKDLWYSVPGPKKSGPIDLLKGITGYAAPGSMTALMGSSGAGKTTLMDVIAGRKTGGTIKGDILLNGFPATDLAIRRCTGYCEQNDIHSVASTFREALTFSAFLRQGADVSDSKKYDSVNECLELLNMEPIADKIIRGSPPEQLKRLTIGVELAAQPSVLFLDEPTSGLDARKAKLIMDGVRKVADSGRTVLCTIHQPSADVFYFFDKLLLLKRGGETVYFGDLGHRGSAIVEYFSQYPGVDPIPENYNPATWMLEVIGAGVGQAADAAGSKAAPDYVASFQVSPQKQKMDLELTQPGMLSPAPDSSELSFTSKRASDGMVQLRMLLQRFFQLFWRTPSYNLTRLTIMVIIAFVYGLAFLNSDYNNYKGINGGIGITFVATVFVGVVTMLSVLPIAADERAAFYRERAAQTYNSLWYFIAFTIVEIPYVLFLGAVFNAIYFPMVGFTGFGVWVCFWLGLCTQILFFAYLGQFLMFALPSVEVAAIFATLFNMIFLNFVGFNPPAASIPAGYKWLYDISPPRYPWSIVASLTFGNCPDDRMDEIIASNRTIDTSDWELGCRLMPDAPSTVGIDNPTAKEYLENTFGVKHAHIGEYVGIYFAILAVIRVLTLLAMRFLNHQKR